MKSLLELVSSLSKGLKHYGAIGMAMGGKLV